MYVTGYPPRVEGIVMTPDVEVGTAPDDPPPTEALPLETVYVHVIPSMVAVAAVTGHGLQATTTAIIQSETVLTNLVVIGVLFPRLHLIGKSKKPIVESRKLDDATILPQRRGWRQRKIGEVQMV